MTSRDFCYWLQGYFEINGKGATLNAEQSDMVQRHLSLVFKHEIDGPDPTGKLQETHDGTKPQRPPYQHPLDTLVRC